MRLSVACVISSGAQGEFEAGVLTGRVQAMILAQAHQPHREHQPVAADLGDQAGRGVDPQPQQLECAALGQVLLEMPAGGDNLLRCARLAHHLQQQHQCLGQGCQRAGPVGQGCLALRSVEVLPMEIGGQIEFAGATGNADAAADGHQPVVLRQALAGLAWYIGNLRKAGVELTDHGVKRRFGDCRVAPKTRQGLLLSIEVLEHVRFHVGARGHIHDLEQCLDRVVVIQRVLARHQHSQPFEKLLEPQIGADAFVEGVFVEDHGLAGCGALMAARGRIIARSLSIAGQPGDANGRVCPRR